ncbi:hypothetical protein ACOME3_001757 [Neoechinorhynchus agilis]
MLESILFWLFLLTSLFIILSYINLYRITFRCVQWLLYIAYGISIECEILNSLTQLSDIKIRVDGDIWSLNKLSVRLRPFYLIEFIQSGINQSSFVSLFKLIKVFDPKIDRLQIVKERSRIIVNNCQGCEQRSGYCIKIDTVRIELPDQSKSEFHHLRVASNNDQVISVSLDRCTVSSDVIDSIGQSSFFSSEYTTSHPAKAKLPRNIIFNVNRIGIRDKPDSNIMVFNVLVNIRCPCQDCAANQPTDITVRIGHIKRFLDQGHVVQILRLFRLKSKFSYCRQEFDLSVDQISTTKLKWDTLFCFINRLRCLYSTESPGHLEPLYCTHMDSVDAHNNEMDNEVICISAEDLNISFQRSNDLDFAIFSDTSFRIHARMIKVILGTSESTMESLRVEHRTGKISLNSSSLLISIDKSFSKLLRRSVDELRDLKRCSISNRIPEIHFLSNQTLFKIMHINGDFLESSFMDLKITVNGSLLFETKAIRVHQNHRDVMIVDKVVIACTEDAIDISSQGETMYILWSPELELFARDCMAECDYFFKISAERFKYSGNKNISAWTKNEAVLGAKINSMEIIKVTFVNIRTSWSIGGQMISTTANEAKWSHGNVTLSKCTDLKIYCKPTCKPQDNRSISCYHGLMVEITIAAFPTVAQPGLCFASDHLRFRKLLDQVLLRGTKQPACLDTKGNKIMIFELGPCILSFYDLQRRLVLHLRFNIGEFYVAGSEPRKHCVTDRSTAAIQLAEIIQLMARLRITFTSSCLISHLISDKCRYSKSQEHCNPYCLVGEKCTYRSDWDSVEPIIPYQRRSSVFCTFLTYLTQIDVPFFISYFRCFECKTLEISIPHDFILRDVWDKFFSVYLWRLRLSSSLEPEMLNDTSISIAEFKFVFDDDPFEVHLTENHLLMTDEKSEACDRDCELNSRIQTLRVQRAISPSAEQNAHEMLNELNSKIYIERSRKLYSTHRRTEFFTIKIDNFILDLDAQPMWSDFNNIIEFINRVDDNGLRKALGNTDHFLFFHWSRFIRAKADLLQMQFRDFRQTLLDVKSVNLEGQLACVDIAQTAYLPYCERFVNLEMYKPWFGAKIKRLILPKKFFHDFNTDLESLTYAFGPCWESCTAQLGIYLRNLLQVKRDPSPRLSWWDDVSSIIGNYPHNPYNVSEEIEWLWHNIKGSWRNNKFVLNGSMRLKSRMRSKYNDSSMVNIPNVNFVLSLNWVIDGLDPNDHYNIILWNPEKLSSCKCCGGDPNKHDAYRLFRSKSVDMTLSFTDSTNPLNSPTFTVYASTLRFCSRVIRILMSVARPIRSGALFKRQRQSRVLFSRHYRNVRVIMNFSSVSFNYWNSFACQSGLNAQCRNLKLDFTYTLSLSSWKDNLLRRKRVHWLMDCIQFETTDAQLYLLSILPINSQDSNNGGYQRFFMTVGKLRVEAESKNGSPTYHVRLFDTRALWDYVNRNLVVELIDTYLRSKLIRQCLASRVLHDQSLLYHEDCELVSVIQASPQPIHLDLSVPERLKSQSPYKRRHSAPSFLAHKKKANKTKQPTISEYLDRFLNRCRSYTETSSKSSEVQFGDVLTCRAKIEIINGQVAMRSNDNDKNGYMILTFGEAVLVNTLHGPEPFYVPYIRRGEEVLSKQVWKGSLLSLQCFGTVGHIIKNDIVWIPKRYTCRNPAPSNLVLVGQTLKVWSGDKKSREFLVVIERCCCDTCLVSFDPLVESDDSVNVLQALELKQNDDLSSKESVDSCRLKSHVNDSVNSFDGYPQVDTLTVVHHDLRILTNSEIYQNVVDIVNDLLLYMRPTRRTPVVEKLKVMMEAQVLDNERVFINKIMRLKEKVRTKLSELRICEKELFYLTRPDAGRGLHTSRTCASKQLNDRYAATKQSLCYFSDRLSLYLSVMKELKLNKKFNVQFDDNISNVGVVGMNRRYEIFVRSGQWTLTTDEQGRKPCARLHVSNALYRKTSFDNCSNEHIVQIGNFQMLNLLKDDYYQCVLAPLCPQPDDMIYLYCKESLPVGGISIREHFELSVSPINIKLTQRFFNECMRFFFSVRHQDPTQRRKTTSTYRTQHPSSDASISFDNLLFDEMSKRAAHTSAFVLVRISEVPICASYKSISHHKKIMDLHEKMLIFPSLEYKNKTWTWHDFVMAIKNDVKRVLLSQAIKHKLGIRRKRKEGKTRRPNKQITSRINHVLIQSNKIVLPALHLTNNNNITTNTIREH